jgi:hypothetical protein
VHGAEPLERGRRQALNRGLIADIGRHRDGVDAQGSDRPSGAGEGVLLDVGEHDVHSVPSEPLGQRQADAARGAGHHSDLPRLELHRSPSFVTKGNRSYRRPVPAFMRFG